MSSWEKMACASKQLWDFYISLKICKKYMKSVAKGVRGRKEEYDFYQSEGFESANKIDYEISVLAWVCGISLLGKCLGEDCDHNSFSSCDGAIQRTHGSATRTVIFAGL